MSRYIEGNLDRNQFGFMAVSFGDMIGEDNPVRVIDAFIYSLDMKELGVKHMKYKTFFNYLYNRKFAVPIQKLKSSNLFSKLKVIQAFKKTKKGMSLWMKV